MIIAIDFDGTCVQNEYPAIGAEMPDVVEVLQRLGKKHRLVLSTARSGERLDDCLMWFVDRGIPLSTYKAKNGIKIFADIYLDDKSLYGLPKNARGLVDWIAIERIINRTKLQAIYDRLKG